MNSLIYQVHLHVAVAHATGSSSASAGTAIFCRKWEQPAGKMNILCLAWI